jgi:hypothetical protein
MLVDQREKVKIIAILYQAKTLYFAYASVSARSRSDPVYGILDVAIFGCHDTGDLERWGRLVFNFFTTRSVMYNFS